jgi:dihydrofolate synthase / folylpolyglutamate synthase
VSPGLKLESLERFGWRFGLETITALLREIGDPHLSLRCVHVAGSNGKGSACAYVASFLKHCGYKTGLYTSPHLCDIRERFRINGVWISRKDFNRHSQKVLKACQEVKKKLGHFPTHFEALTAMAFSWFQEQKVDWLVLEVGLGGRLDATNVIPAPAVSLITPIGLEHQDILGKSIGKIAWEKAGILKPGSPAATVQYRPEASRVIEKAARQTGANLWIGGRDFKFRRERGGFYWEGPGLRKRFRVSPMPDTQITNAALALAGIQCLGAAGVATVPGTIQKSLSATHWPGRFERVSHEPLVMLDGAHHPDGARALFSFLKRRYSGKRWIVLNGFLDDKDYSSFARVLAPLTELSLVTEPPSGRAEKGKRVFEAWERRRCPALLVQDWSRALSLALMKARRSPKSGLLITGSLYLVGACRERLLGLKGLNQI